MSKSTGELRALWRAYECAEDKMVVVPFCGDRIRVAPETVDAWAALASVLTHHGYEVRTGDTDSYNCRTITGGTEKSLHSYGIALDVNWTTNPYKDHLGEREVIFSRGVTQADRAQDVKRNLADTDMTLAMIEDVRRIETTAGDRVFEWGGDWRSVKDSMHFELDLGPAELASGIDWSTVAGHSDGIATVGPLDHVLDNSGSASDRHYVNARQGLRLRSTPSESGEVTRVLPLGTAVGVLKLQGDWALVDLEGDAKADGYMFYSYLSRTAPSIDRPAPSSSGGSNGFSVDIVQRMFPATKRANIESNLPHVLRAMRVRGLGDTAMVLMALATIRAETEGFVPISEFQSKYNTKNKPFDLYDGRLGNGPGEGVVFKGRGFVQLTGRSNYEQVGNAIGIDLADDPEKANDPSTAATILAEFLGRREGKLRAALARGDLKEARRLINGGSHGFDRFRDAYDTGRKLVG